MSTTRLSGRVLIRCGRHLRERGGRGGTATAGTPTFSGTETRFPLTGVANQQIVTVRVSGVNGGSASADVPFGFLIADASANRVVDKSDQVLIRGQEGQPVTSVNFREDVRPDGTINRNDEQQVRVHKRQNLP